MYHRHNKLYAFDESTIPYELDPHTLKTFGADDLGFSKSRCYSAHSKIDAQTKDWIHFGLHYFKDITVHITIFDKTGKLKFFRDILLPRNSYMHDFFVSENYIVFHLAPLIYDYFPLITGKTSITGSFFWEPEVGTLLMIVSRTDKAMQPMIIETSPSWMWHGFNAYEKNKEIICDFIGYNFPDHFIGDNPIMTRIMENQPGDAHFKGQHKRHIIHLKSKSSVCEMVNAENFEFPVINPYTGCYQTNEGYSIYHQTEGIFHSAIAHHQFDSGQFEFYDFGARHYCSEPVLAKTQNNTYLLTLVYNAEQNQSFLAILNAAAIKDGPIARAILQHPMPITFHGCFIDEKKLQL